MKAHIEETTRSWVIQLRLVLACAIAISIGGCLEKDSSEIETVQTQPDHKTGTNSLCEKDEDCADGEFCDPTISICRKGCSKDGDCKDGTVCNTADNVCVSCLVDEDCNFGVCHPKFKSCVSCLEDDDCESGACIEELFSCVQCEEDSDCKEGVCVESLNMCRECEKDEGCDDGDPCTRDYCKDNVCTHPQVSNVIGCFGVECLSPDDCPVTDEVGCPVCDKGKCGSKTEVQACATTADCLEEAPNACFEAECKPQECGGASCFYNLAPECDACETDDDCPVGPQDCSNTCEAGTCVALSLGEEGCECVVPSDCGSNTECQAFSCDENTCSVALKDDGELCDDGNECTIQDSCASGICLGGKVIAECGISCSQESDCGINALGCSGDCVDGTCLFPPLAGSCPQCLTEAECDDGNSCTEEKCVKGNCFVSGFEGTFSCDDGDDCTVQDQCAAGVCAGVPLPGCPGECSDASDCPKPEVAVCSISCIDFGCVYEEFPPACPGNCPPPPPCFQVACADTDCGKECAYEAIPNCKLCSSDSECDDKNPCTKTYCDKATKTCQSAKLSNVPCATENPCITGVCTSGSCTVNASDVTEKSCDDGNPCTIDSCGGNGCENLADAGAMCDDGNPCTLMDTCNEAGDCSGPPGGLVLDPICGEEGSVCEAPNACESDAECSDAYTCQCIPSCLECGDCMAKACVPDLEKLLELSLLLDDNGSNAGQSIAPPDYYVCNDAPQKCVNNENCACLPSCPACNDCLEFVCWEGTGCKECSSSDDCGSCEECSDGLCLVPKECQECGKDADCGSSCLACVEKSCEPIPDCTECKKEEDCPSPCQACENQLCVDVEGCAACEADSDCEGLCETCSEGTCKEKEDCKECATSKDCSDVCAVCSGGECVVEPECIPCSKDGDCPSNFCGGCVDGVCEENENVELCSEVTCQQPDDPCQMAVCVEEACKAECVIIEDNACSTCEDDGDCISEDKCLNLACINGDCMPQALVSCDDKKPCTMDSCVPTIGCVHETESMNGSACDDGNACTLLSTCSEGACTNIETILACDDGEPCTADECDADIGCTFPPLESGTPCEDGDLCTLQDTCEDGSCSPGAFKTCPDGEVCSVNTCDPSTGACVQEPLNGIGCDTGDPCNPTGLCVASECVAADNPSEENECNPDESGGCPGGSVCTLSDCVYKCVQTQNTLQCCQNQSGNPFVTDMSCPDAVEGGIQIQAKMCEGTIGCCTNKDGDSINANLFDCFEFGGSPSNPDNCSAIPGN